MSELDDLLRPLHAAQKTNNLRTQDVLKSNKDPGKTLDDLGEDNDGLEASNVQNDPRLSQWAWSPAASVCNHRVVPRTLHRTLRILNHPWTKLLPMLRRRKALEWEGLVFWGKRFPTIQSCQRDLREGSTTFYE